MPRESAALVRFFVLSGGPCASVQMPRTAVGSSRGLALRSNGQNPESTKNVKSSVGLRGPTQTKNGGNKATSKAARAALGEITNVSSIDATACRNGTLNKARY